MEDDRAVGVELEGGQRHAAGTVISAADGRWTISEALGGRYVDAAICDLHDGKTMDLSDAVIPVSLGVARTFEREPWLFRFPFADPPVPPTARATSG